MCVCMSMDSYICASLHSVQIVIRSLVQIRERSRVYHLIWDIYFCFDSVLKCNIRPTMLACSSAGMGHTRTPTAYMYTKIFIDNWHAHAHQDHTTHKHHTHLDPFPALTHAHTNINNIYKHFPRHGQALPDCNTYWYMHENHMYSLQGKNWHTHIRAATVGFLHSKASQMAFLTTLLIKESMYDRLRLSSKRRALWKRPRASSRL
jgi:hypothetical protein